MRLLIPSLKREDLKKKYWYGVYVCVDSIHSVLIIQGQWTEDKRRYSEHLTLVFALQGTAGSAAFEICFCTLSLRTEQNMSRMPLTADRY